MPGDINRAFSSVKQTAVVTLHLYLLDFTAFDKITFDFQIGTGSTGITIGFKAAIFRQSANRSVFPGTGLRTRLLAKVFVGIMGRHITTRDSKKNHRKKYNSSHICSSFTRHTDHDKPEPYRSIVLIQY